jgi:hypothetical protein
MSTPLGHDRGIRRAIATVCLSGMLEDKLDTVARAGFDGVEIFENDLFASSSTPAEVRKRALTSGFRSTFTNRSAISTRCCPTGSPQTCAGPTTSSQ